MIGTSTCLFAFTQPALADYINFTAPSNFAPSGPTGVNGLDCTGGNGQCTYTPLEPLPGFPSQFAPSNQDNGTSFFKYLNAIITLLVIIGAMLAVGNFSVGGIIYMVSSVADTKKAANSRMWGSIWGLLLLISSVLILQTLNPQLVQFNLSSLNVLGNSGSTSNPANLAPSQ